MIVRSYTDKDFGGLTSLYKDESSYGGHYDEERDNRERLKAQSDQDPEPTLVAEADGEIVGSISLIYDKRSAWFFRFAVKDANQHVAQALYSKAQEVLKAKGHNMLLGYSPIDNATLDKRYKDLGSKHGGNYTNYWIDF